MKAKLFYILPFVFAFVVVTGGLIYFNSIYQNIFGFDFSPIQSLGSQQDSTKTGTDSTKTLVKKDSVNIDQPFSRNKLDSLLTFYKNNSDPEKLSMLQKDSTLSDSINTLTKLINELKPVGVDSTKKTVDIIDLNETDKTKDAEYLDWIKKITSIYETMEPRKAAKIIQNYSDNVARDILYTMKKKTAAKVIAELSPETVNRIIRFQ